MIIKVIFGQRKESYLGEYAPEALEVMDEYRYSENPDWLNGKYSEYEASKDFSSLRIIDIHIDNETLVGILNVTPAMTGKIKK